MKRLLTLPILIVMMAVSAYAVMLERDDDAFVDRLAAVESVDPTKAFIYFEDMDDDTDALVDDILDYAGSFLGKPYRRGSKGPSAFDCSGFTSFVFRNFDISLSASSSAQYLQGDEVALDEVRPGDLLFFSGARGGKSRVGHVALAVDVDDHGTITFIHAATSGGIRYDVYPDGGYYSNRYMGARRVVK